MTPFELLSSFWKQFKSVVLQTSFWAPTVEVMEGVLAVSLDLVWLPDH